MKKILIWIKSLFSPIKKKSDTFVAHNYILNHYERCVIDNINLYRISLGLNELYVNTEVSNICYLNNIRMIADGKISHNGLDIRFKEVSKLTGALSIGENLAINFSEINKVVNAWIKSEPHHKNLVGKYSHISISITPDEKGKLYYTNIFYLKRDK